MGAAKSVLDSDAVKEAIEAHAADGDGADDGLTEAQREHFSFLKNLDAEREAEAADEEQREE